MLDRPVIGRIFFEQVIRDNLDIGRPDQVGADLRPAADHRRAAAATPGRFRTRVITDGVTPSLHVDYKHATIKQYHKEGRALRTETTINDTRDFGIGKRLTNLPALREIGFPANRRLLGVQRLSHDPTRGADAFTAVTDPIITANGTRVAGLRFADPRAHALLARAAGLPAAARTGSPTATCATTSPSCSATTPDCHAGQMTYDLRRLRIHGLITRIPHTHRYHVTDTGLHHALFLTRVHDRLLRTGLADLTDPTPSHCAPPAAPTKPPSTPSPDNPAWPHET